MSADNTSAPSRRGLLSGLLAAATAPAWITGAFAAEPPARQLELFATWHAARRARTPLLAIVIPDTDRSTRGRIVGAMLGEAQPALLAKLSGYAPVCATAFDLHLLGVVLPKTAWFAVINTASVPAEVTPVDGPSPAAEEWETDIDRIAMLLASALAALRTPPSSGSLRSQNAKLGHSTWVNSRLPGSYWANAGGCGLHIEEYERDNQYMLACGMGHMPARAARFLYFVDEQ
ncbi:MAG: hypothetical protein ACI8PZ_003598 [Myxococcota bacterium]|jgi:hypothetical protein